MGAHDMDSSLTSTKLNVGPSWMRKRSESLLLQPKSESLSSSKKKAERNKAFELLDALSRSGFLPIDCAELHVIIATTHCFDKSLINTVVKDNINPIEKIEKSLLLIGSTFYCMNAKNLIRNKEQVTRVIKHSSYLLKDEED